MDGVTLMLIGIIFFGIYLLYGMWDMKRTSCSFGGANNGRNYEGPEKQLS